MRNLALTLIFLALAFPMRTFCQSQWISFSDSMGRFKVMLPGKPTKTAESPPTFTLGTASGVYVISYTDGHEGADWVQTVNSERDATVQGLNAKVLGEKEVSLDGYRGKAVRFECSLASGPVTGPTSGEMKIFFNGHRYYMLLALIPKAASSDRASKFVDSFQLLPSSKSQ